MDWNERSVFVTGATGLVGSWLVKALINKGARTTVLVRDQDPQSELIRSGDINRTTVVNGKLEDLDTLERALAENEIETVFHLGAQTIVGTALRQPIDTFESNIRGTYNLMEACRRQQSSVKRIVVASSDKAYGTSDVLPYTEEMPLQGEGPYDCSKSCTDLIATSYAKTYGLPVAIARCGNIYGGGDLNWSRIIPGTFRSLYNRTPPIIRSNGKFTRDYIFVKDVVSAYMTLAQHLDKDEIKGEAFNFGPNRPYNVLEIVSAIQKLMDCEDLSPKILDQAKAEIPDQTLCSKKAERMLKWSPTYDLEAGLEETILWYSNYLGAGEINACQKENAAFATVS